MKVDLTTVTAADEMSGEDEEETTLLREAMAEAEEYLLTFAWCRSIKERFFGLGIGGVVAVFLFQIEADSTIDEWLWVITGDLPSAYLVTDRAGTPVRALAVYCDLMEEWVDAVQGGEGLQDIFPVQAAPTTEHAQLLEKRLTFLRREVIPAYEA